MLNLPERSGYFLDLLQKFMAEPAMKEFGRGARQAFLGDEDEVGEDEAADFVDYAQFGHCDAGGRSLVDHFLAARAGILAPQEREVLERMRQSVYGVFHVEEVDPGRGFTLRRSGSEERFEVVEVEGSRSLKRGMGVVMRLIPYRGRYEVTGNLRAIPPEAAYSSERITARAGEAAAREAMTPIALRQIFKPRRSRPFAPENRLEAELNAASVFVEVKFPLSVEETQRRFQSMDSFLDLMKTPGLCFDSMEDLQRFTNALTGLWNHTPRDDLGGLSPAEKQAELAAAGRPEIPLHLLEDLKNEVLAKIDPADFPDDESRQAAIRELQEQWFSTPQKELGGRTPREAMQGSLPPLPDESSLPASHRPAWPLERVRELLAAKRPASVLWAVRQAAARAEPLEAAEIAGAVAFLLKHVDLLRSFPSIRDLDGHPAAGAVAQAVAAHLRSLDKGSYDQNLALKLLARFAPGEHLKAFARGVKSRDDLTATAALDGLAAGRSEGAALILFDALGRTRSALVALVALLGLCRLRSAGAAGRGARLFIEHFAGAVKGGRMALDGLLDEVGNHVPVSTVLFGRVEDSLFPVDEPPPDAAARRAIFLPRDDPAAARRAEEIVGPEGAGRILALADAGDHRELARLLGDLTLRAIERAARENPAFGPLGSTLAAMTSSLLEWDGLQGLDEEDREMVLSVLGAFLAKAIRGRDLAREREEAGEDRAQLLGLCRVDEDWIDDRALELMVRLLRAEDLETLSGAMDSDVLLTRALLLAALDPGRHLSGAVPALARSKDWVSLLRALVRSGGDAVLSPLVAAAREQPAGWTIGVLAAALELLGTERARVALELYVEEFFRAGFPALELLQLASAAGSRRAAERVISLIREGAFNLERAARYDLDLHDLKMELDVCLEVLAIRGDADEILAEGWRASGGSIPGQDDEDEEDGEDEEDEEDEEDDGGGPGFGWDAPDIPKPVAPIIREAPKARRNGPCPCGSGRKYKQCCGKGA